MKLLLFTILFLFPIITFSQNDPATVLVDTAKVYESYEVDSPAEYPGGASEMVQFIWENFEYTDSARLYQENQKIWVEFIINQNGTISDIKILRGQKYSGIDMKRVVSIMPTWKPAELNGVKVKETYSLSMPICLR